MAVAEGQQVGNYRVLNRIGTGGMGAVYLAEHPVIGKKVALKVIHRELAGNKEVISRFYQEARAVTKIGNEHIVEIHDFGQSPEGDHFFIMEYLEGQTLAQLLARDRVLDTGRALHIAAQVGDALCAAHQSGIIHRDLKPDNVMLCTRLGDPTFVKLLDFGLAKMYDGGARNLTAQGVVLGTPQYMSPEACESKKDIDHRTDIYALGVLLFQMLTGQVPFDGQTMGEVLIKQVMHAPPAPRALNPHIPPSVEQIILRCLAKSPDARFPTMLALREALLDPDRYLMSSPPMMPAAMPSAHAQSVTMYATAAMQGAPAPQPPTAAGHPGLALKPPNEQRTMIDTDQMGHAATAAFSLPASAQSSDPMLRVPPAPPGGGTGSVPTYGTRRMSVAPDQAQPMQPQNQTMVIATPPGFSAHPPRRGLAWMIVGVSVVLVVAAIVLVMTMGKSGTQKSGTETAVATGSAETGSGSALASGSDTGSETGSGSATGSGPASATGSGSGSATGSATGSDTGSDTGTGSGSAAGSDTGTVEAVDAGAVTKMATIIITSDPSGAEVFDSSGTRLGKTPTEVGVLADGTEHTFVLKHPKAKERSKTVAATGDTTIEVILERLPRSGGSGRRGGSDGSGKASGKGSGKGTSGDIMEPGFLR